MVLAQEDAALADYKAADLRLHDAGTIYFPKDEDSDVRSKFEYCKCTWMLHSVR